MTTPSSPPFEFFAGEREVFSRRRRGSTFDWTRDNLVLVSGPYVNRRWRPEVLPYAQGVMDAWDDPATRKVFFVSGSQAGKTTMFYACLFSAQQRKPGPAAVVMPDQDAVARTFEKKLQPLVAKSPALTRRLSGYRHAMTRDEIEFRDGSFIHGLWAGSESRMSSESYEYLLIDEEDAYPDRTNVATAEERVTAYEHTAKVARFSKPRGAEGEGTIWEDMHRQAEVIYGWQAVCPACSHPQHMRFDQIKVPEGMRDPGEILGRRLAWYECEECGYHWDDRRRDLALSRGFWQADRPGVVRPTVVGFHLRSWESPFVSLSKVMSEWFAAQGDPKRMLRWTNNHDARPYRTVVAETTEERLLRLVDPSLQPLVLPAETDVVTMAVDMQARHFVYDVWAHRVLPDHKLASWVVEAGTIPDWEALTAMVLDARYALDGKGSATLGLWRMALDTGGGEGEDGDPSRTQQAWLWLAKMAPHRICHGTKGMSRTTGTDYVKWAIKERLPDGKLLRGGLKLHLVDTDAFKRLLLHSRLTEDAEEPVRFVPGLTAAYFRQLCAEQLQVEKGREVWKKVRRDNHHLDTAVLHLAMTHWQWTPSLQASVTALREARNPVTTPATPPPPAVNPYTGGGDWFARR